MPQAEKIDLKKIRSLLYYSETSPTCLRWKDTGDNNPSRPPRGVAGSSVHRKINIDYKSYDIAFIVCCLFEKEMQTNYLVDFIDGNKKNFNKKNLVVIRPVSQNVPDIDFLDSIQDYKKFEFTSKDDKNLHDLWKYCFKKIPEKYKSGSGSRYRINAYKQLQKRKDDPYWTVLLQAEKLGRVQGSKAGLTRAYCVSKHGVVNSVDMLTRWIEEDTLKNKQTNHSGEKCKIVDILKENKFEKEKSLSKISTHFSKYFLTYFNTGLTIALVASLLIK